MTWLELKQWCKDNNVPDDAVMLSWNLDEFDNLRHSICEPHISNIDSSDSFKKRHLGITDTTPMVVEL